MAPVAMKQGTVRAARRLREAAPDRGWLILHGDLPRLDAALCVAESDDLATPRVRTAPFGYLRLRKAEYDDAQLESWAAWVRGAGFTQDVFCYFKHEDEARGPRFAEQFRRTVEGLSASGDGAAAQSTPAT